MYLKIMKKKISKYNYDTKEIMRLILAHFVGLILVLSELSSDLHNPGCLPQSTRYDITLLQKIINIELVKFIKIMCSKGSGVLRSSN